MTRLILSALLIGAGLTLTGCMRDNSPEPADAPPLGAEEEAAEVADEVVSPESETHVDREKPELSHEEVQEEVRKRLEELREKEEE